MNKRINWSSPGVHAEDKRIADRISSEVYNAVWLLLDSDADVDSETAGAIATAAEQDARRIVMRMLRVCG